MKTIVIAQTYNGAQALCSGLREISDELILISFSGVEIQENISDRLARVELPEQALIDDAFESIKPFIDQENPDQIIVESTRALKVIAGKLSASNKIAAISEVVNFDNGRADTMYYGGTSIRSYQTSVKQPIYIVSPQAFNTIESSGNQTEETIAWLNPARSLVLVEENPIEKQGVDLNSADVVVAAGRGFGSKEDLALGQQLADKLNGGLGCTRPLTEGVDWMPRESYIGVSGLMLKPSVYVAVGVSGQMQHMVGVSHAGQNFAINKDKNAQNFRQCDFGLVGDLNDVLPKLIDQL